MATNIDTTGFGSILFLAILCAEYSVMANGEDRSKETRHPLAVCRDRLKWPATKDLMVLKNIVGVGWDNLMNVQMGNIMHVTYEKCQTTPDGLYLIPDDVTVSSVQGGTADLMSERYKDFNEYADATDDHVGVDVSTGSSVPATVSGSFNKEWQDVKKKSVETSSSIMRSQIQYHAYTVILNTDAPFTDAFNRRLHEIRDYQQKNDTAAAEYLAQLLVRDFGTHVIREAKVGVELNQYDYVNTRAMDESHEILSGLKIAASARFNETISAGAGISQEDKENVSSGYSSSLTHSEIRSRGGFDALKFMQQTSSGGDTDSSNSLDYFFIDDVVPLTRHGQLLSDTITIHSNALDMNSTSEVVRIASSVKTAISTYFDKNTKYGCMNANAAGYDFSANAENESACQWPNHNYTFYGVYQTCTVDWERWRPPNGTWIDASVVNEMTGEMKCDHNAENKLVGRMRLDTNIPEARIFGFQYTAELRWCRYRGPVPARSGLMFGGIYSDTQPNPLTRSASCPGQFRAIKLSVGITLCTSRNYEVDHKFAIDFGGFISCETAEKNCPTGYTNYFLLRYNLIRIWRKKNIKLEAVKNVQGCDLYYCIKPTDIPQYTLSDSNRPPYMEAPWINAVEESANATAFG